MQQSHQHMTPISSFNHGHQGRSVAAFGQALIQRVRRLRLAAPVLACAMAAWSVHGAWAAETDARIPAIKIYNTADDKVAFVRGTIPALNKIENKEFWFSNVIEAWQEGNHPAPRRQYVVSLKGTLVFKVSDGSTFRLEPGTVLLAEDVRGAGHSWAMAPGTKEWVRMYIPMASEDDKFQAAP